MGADFLAGMAIASRRRVRWNARRVSEADLRRRAAEQPPPPPLELSAAGFDVFAEVKRRTPSVPELRDDPRLPERLARAYVRGGAAAVSVLTEPLAFAGSLEDLERAAGAAAASARPIPAMRKDFLVDPYQVFEARAAGAGGALLIAELLQEGAGAALVDAAGEAGLWLLVEVFSAAGVDRAGPIIARAGRADVPVLIGVNTRDLRTLELDPSRLGRMAALVTDTRFDGARTVAESGLRTPDDASRAARMGYGAALVGGALSGSADPAALLGEMLRAGRAARREAA